ncbi:hypothetical protein [Burkholderia aenigmatica]|uniref:hypothetical protein n=1 Tax=Burkholderia aenigmatica TaxID=2015348 RepID=UPI001178B796|nr:hypothetical protein [Burkholderia aenigmatica]
MLGLHGFIEAADEVFGRRHEHGAVAEQQIDIARGPLPDEIERRGGRPYVRISDSGRRHAAVPPLSY